MQIISLVVITILFIITWIVISCNSDSSFPPVTDTVSNYLRKENTRLEREYRNIRQQLEYQNYHRYPCVYHPNCFCNKLQRNFYAKTPQEQSIADLLKKTTLTIEEIAEKLDIKII